MGIHGFNLGISKYSKPKSQTNTNTDKENWNPLYATDFKFLVENMYMRLNTYDN